MPWNMYMNRNVEREFVLREGMDEERELTVLARPGTESRIRIVEIK